MTKFLLHLWFLLAALVWRGLHTLGYDWNELQAYVWRGIKRIEKLERQRRALDSLKGL